MGVPMEVVAIEGLAATCRARGVERVVSLLWLGEDAVTIGDHVLVHLGRATERLTPAAAAEAWETLDALLALSDEASDQPPSSVLGVTADDPINSV
jgi:hydrogenase expression/formation protein HypC